MMGGEETAHAEILTFPGHLRTGTTLLRKAEPKPRPKDPFTDLSFPKERARIDELFPAPKLAKHQLHGAADQFQKRPLSGLIQTRFSSIIFLSVYPPMKMLTREVPVWSNRHSYDEQMGKFANLFRIVMCNTVEVHQEMTLGQAIAHAIAPFAARNSIKCGL